MAGTASHVGKSTVVTGLCRLLDDHGVDVTAYKAQNMSNNARAVPTPAGDFGEIGVSQYVQARAARNLPTTDVNPVLLKPRGGGESQLVIQGTGVGHVGTGDYYGDQWKRARDAAVESYDRLANAYDTVVAEGAGSIAEINLHDRDLANVETARFSEAEILLVADIDRGGAFAALVGTLELLPGDLREQVGGAILNKFRGERTVLTSGIDEFESRTGVPILGVLPYDDPGLPQEDSVSLPRVGERTVKGQGDGVPVEDRITIVVPRFPHVSNATDLDPLARQHGVRVVWEPLDATLEDADAVVLPGTKNTVDDLLASKDAGLGRALRRFDGPIVGLCGGYQMLGERLTNACVESTDNRQQIEGFGLLPVETRFSTDKHVESVIREIRGVGPLAGARGRVSGYEIHMGDTELVGSAERPFQGEGAAVETVLGTYLHGLFENQEPREAFLKTIYTSADRESPPSGDRHERRARSGGTSRTEMSATVDHVPPAKSPSPHDTAADLLSNHLDLSVLSLR